MKINYTILILLLSGIFYSCNNGVETEIVEPVVELVDTSSVKSSALMGDIDNSKKKHEVKEFKENLKVIEKKYGEQWGFCECVVANDSVNVAIINLKDFDGPKFDKLMERSDFITTKCQAFLSMDSSKTPEERQKHEQKVKKCLKAAKKK